MYLLLPQYNFIRIMKTKMFITYVMNMKKNLTVMDGLGGGGELCARTGTFVNILYVVSRKVLFRLPALQYKRTNAEGAMSRKY